MDIKLITWIGENNYGTALQAYALYRKVTDLGHEVSILLPTNHAPRLSATLKSLLHKLGASELLKYLKVRKDPKLKKFFLFNQKNIKTTKVYTERGWQRMIGETDVFLTGSDQIWNTHYCYSSFYFLDFAADKKRIAYASSMGTADFLDEYKADIRQLLCQFQHIGVREQAAVEAIAELTGRKDVVQVLDPTFLLSPQEWGEMASTATLEFGLPKSYILCYLIGNNDHYARQLEDIRKQTEIATIVIIPAAENQNFSVQGAYVYKQAGPEEFVYLIGHASLVCTDSFHATALSINLSVNFVEFMRFKDADKASQNSRIYDVLDHYGLRSRIYSVGSDACYKDIDYAPVADTLSADRMRSTDYLTNSIKQ